MFCVPFVTSDLFWCEREEVVSLSANQNENRDGRHWHAVHTRSRHEKLVDELLVERSVESFLPLKRVHSQWKDRKKWVEKPLFPGYLFVRIHTEEIPVVRGTRGVARLLGPEPLKPSIVPDDEIENIRRLVTSQVPLDPYPYLKPGQTVCITRGALRGVEGTIIQKKNRYLLVVSVNLLGRSVAAEVSGEAVQGL
jgi:transcription antitermination factor NusG